MGCGPEFSQSEKAPADRPDATTRPASARGCAHLASNPKRWRLMRVYQFMKLVAILDAWEEDLRRGEVGTGAAQLGRLIYRPKNGITPPDVAPAAQRLQAGGVRGCDSGVTGYSTPQRSFGLAQGEHRERKEKQQQGQLRVTLQGWGGWMLRSVTTTKRPANWSLCAARSAVMIRTWSRRGCRPGVAGGRRRGAVPRDRPCRRSRGRW